MRHRRQCFHHGLGPWRVWGRCSPHDGLAWGGDGLFVTTAADSGLRFAVADAAGHGAAGAAFWRCHGDRMEASWERFLLAEGGDEALRQLGWDVNAWLDDDGAGDTLCLAAGSWAHDGGLCWATFGYGCHVFVSHGAQRDVYRAPADRLFGLKLGWFDTDEWSREPRAFCAHAIGDARRVMITTDAWFPQDHRDIPGTLVQAHDLGVRCAALDGRAVLPRLFSLPHASDDATALLIERSEADSGITGPSGAGSPAP